MSQDFLQILCPKDPYQRYGRWLNQKFGCKVYKIPLHAGFTCPNVDGSLSRGGCTYCNNTSFHPGEIDSEKSISEQIKTGMRFLRREFKVKKFIAYFQTFSNTYAPVSFLENLYSQPLAFPDIIGISIGTRPDCINKEKISLLEDLAQSTFLTVEYGLQSMHDHTLRRIRRGHNRRCFEQAIEISANRSFQICVHVILGLPGETHEDLMQTANYLAHLPIDSIKIHNLYIAKKTVMASQYRNKKIKLFSQKDYVDTVCDFLERLPPQVTIQRLCGDTGEDLLIAPSWCQQKPQLLKMIRERFQERKTYQGRLFHEIISPAA